MNARDFNRAIAKLFPDAAGKGQSEAARFLGISDRTVRDYASGFRDVPAPVAKFLGYMVGAGINPADVDAALAKPPDKPKRGKP